MANDSRPKLVIAISSTALFDMGDSHTIFESEGVEAYGKHLAEVDRENARLAKEKADKEAQEQPDLLHAEMMAVTTPPDFKKGDFADFGTGRNAHTPDREEEGSDGEESGGDSVDSTPRDTLGRRIGNRGRPAKVAPNVAPAQQGDGSE